MNITHFVMKLFKSSWQWVYPDNSPPYRGIGPDEWLYLNSIGFLFWTGSQWSSVNMGVT